MIAITINVLLVGLFPFLFLGLIAYMSIKTIRRILKKIRIDNVRSNRIWAFKNTRN